MNGNHSRLRTLRRQLVGVAGAGALLLGATACGEDVGGSGDGPLVVVTHSILADVVRNVVGEEATVEQLMPVGADPHEFEPSAAQAALLAEADLVVANGLDFEQGLTDALGAAAEEGADVLELAEDLDPLPFADPHGHAEDEEHAEEEDAGEEHDHGSEDPHWFSDPQRVLTASGIVADAVSGLEGVDADVIAAQADDYAAALTAADAEVEEQLSAIPGDARTLVTNHEVFGYFAERYDFEVVGVVIPGGSTLAEPSSAELGELVETIEEAGVQAIFADASASTDLAAVLADETGGEVEVVELFTESLGEEGSGGETYLDLIATNAERIVDALA